MKSQLLQFNVGMSRETVSLSNHDPLWFKAYDFVRKELIKQISVEIDLYQVGSTAIEGITA